MPSRSDDTHHQQTADEMIQQLRIQSYRCFEDLQINPLARINLFAGRNNSGKTTVLEAVTLLSGAGDSTHVLVIHDLRGVQIDELAGTPQSIRNIIWKPLFPAFDLDKTIRIEARNARHGAMRLEMSLERTEGAVLILHKPSEPPHVGNEALRLLYTSDSAEPWERRVVIKEGTGIQTHGPGRRHPLSAGFLPTRSRDGRQDALKLGELRRRKQSHLLTEALRIVEPRLQSIEENSVAGYPMIWGDIGLPELAPLSTMGEGMTRLASILLTIATVGRGVVLIDEIENGIHHSAMNDVWRVVADAARRFDTQVFATTHSFECMEAAHDALDTDLLFHRLEIGPDGRNRCVTFEPDNLSTAIDYGLEIR